MTTNVVSFDYDSTLSLTHHRRHLLATGDDYAEKTDWIAYGLACDGDSDGPALPIAQHYSRLGIPFIVVSGRCEESREKSTKWLHDRDTFPWAVYLVDGRHNKMDHGAWKAMRLKELEAQNNWKIVYHYDDLSVVADATAKVGIPTILVHESGKLGEAWG